MCVCVCSLRVNLDMGKSAYGWMIMKDEHIPGTVVRTSTIPEELGRLVYLLTDKTGTFRFCIYFILLNTFCFYLTLIFLALFPPFFVLKPLCPSTSFIITIDFSPDLNLCLLFFQAL